MNPDIQRIAEHIKCDPSLSDDESDELVIHLLAGGRIMLEIYQGPGLGTHRTQAVLESQAAKQLRTALQEEGKSIREIADRHFDPENDPHGYDEGLLALTELSALRDTQERELREKVSWLPANWFEDASLETWFPLTAETLKEQEETITSLRAELARRDEAEKELREEVEEALSDASHYRDQLFAVNTTNASLRSRIGELEGKLGENV